MGISNVWSKPTFCSVRGLDGACEYTSEFCCWLCSELCCEDCRLETLALLLLCALCGRFESDLPRNLENELDLFSKLLALVSVDLEIFEFAFVGVDAKLSFTWSPSCCLGSILLPLACLSKGVCV